MGRHPASMSPYKGHSPAEETVLAWTALSSYSCGPWWGAPRRGVLGAPEAFAKLLVISSPPFEGKIVQDRHFIAKHLELCLAHSSY